MLEVLDGGEARTVKLHVEGKNPPRLVGQTALLVHNTSGKAAGLCATFVAADGSSELRLPGNSKWVFLERIRSSSTGSVDAAMKKNEVRALRLRFSLPPDEPRSAVDGSLLLELGGETKVVALTGATLEFKDVAVQPKELDLDTARDTATLTLAGLGLAEFLRFRGPGVPTAELRDGSGNVAKVTVSLPTAAEVVAKPNPYRAQATIELPDDSPPAGKYTGTLVLSDVGGEGLAVELELHSHRSILCLILLALAGVLIGGVLTRLVTLAMRRSLLLKALDESMAAYKRVLACNDTESWHLEDLLDEPPSPASLSGTRLQGVPALRGSIESARSSKDLDEDAARVLDTVARIQRWLRVEPVARRLALVAEDEPRGPLKSGEKWLRSRTWRDTQILLELARVEPQTPAAADDLVTRLLSQIEWHHRFVIAWDEVAKLKGLSEELAKIDKSLGEDGEVVNRKPELQDALDVRLEAFFKEELKPRRVSLTEPPKPMDPEDADLGITPVRWDASANLFTGWATLDAQSYGQLSRRAATTARALSPPSLGMELNSIHWSDGVWTLVLLALASAAYGVEGYNDTWGSGKDLATAFLAGFAGKVVVDWAAIPIFQSIRIRTSESQGTVAPISTAEAEPAKAEPAG